MNSELVSFSMALVEADMSVSSGIDFCELPQQKSKSRKIKTKKSRLSLEVILVLVL
jgi:hypothetical protein